MLKLEKKSYGVVGLGMAIVSFILLFVGIKFISGMDVALQNYLAYGIFSIIMGAIAALFVYFRLNIAFMLFIAGYIAGFILMYKSFLYDMSGWGDLAGIISLMLWLIIGLGVGLLSQLVYYFVRKSKRK